MLAHRATCTETPHEVPQPLHVVPFRALVVDFYADAVPLGHNARLCACLLGFGLGGEEVEEVLKGLTANSKEYLPVAILPLTEHRRVLDERSWHAVIWCFVKLPRIHEGEAD